MRTWKKSLGISVLGQKRTSPAVDAPSALPPKPTFGDQTLLAAEA